MMRTVSGSATPFDVFIITSRKPLKKYPVWVVLSTDVPRQLWMFLVWPKMSMGSMLAQGGSEDVQGTCVSPHTSRHHHRASCLNDNRRVPRHHHDPAGSTVVPWVEPYKTRVASFQNDNKIYPTHANNSMQQAQVDLLRAPVTEACCELLFACLG